MEKIRITLKDNVAETLLIPLWMRAEESKRSDALFHDEISCKLVIVLIMIFQNLTKTSIVKMELQYELPT